MAELPLYFCLVTHVVVIVNTVVGLLEMAREAGEVVELQLFAHLLDVSLVDHLKVFNKGFTPNI